MKEKIEILWCSLREVKELILKRSNFDNKQNIDSNEYRLDDLGAIIKKSDYGLKTDFGWNVDHIFPISKGGSDNVRNLRLLHWRNNELKGNDFPTYSWSTQYDWDSIELENIEKLRPRFTFTANYIETFSDLYPNILEYRVSEKDAIMI